MTTAIKPRPAHRPSKQPDTEELKSRYSTMTQPEMAKLYSVSIRTIARWLKTAGISKHAQ